MAFFQKQPKEGENWVEYEIPSMPVAGEAAAMFRITAPPKEYPDADLHLAIERAVGRFNREHTPEYKRGDVADLYIDRKGDTFRIKVSYWPNASEGQI